ncbi:hypothetical protein T439DRAFT_380139 [Meredithblackwellia eburnea MCA 4105]
MPRSKRSLAPDNASQLEDEFDDQDYDYDYDSDSDFIPQKTGPTHSQSSTNKQSIQQQQQPKRPKFKRVRKYTSCENCIEKKRRCSKGSPCAPCIMRGLKCQWVRGKPAEPDDDGHLRDEIRRLQIVIKVLSTRLENNGLPTNTTFLPDELLRQHQSLKGTTTTSGNSHGIEVVDGFDFNHSHNHHGLGVVVLPTGLLSPAESSVELGSSSSSAFVFGTPNSATSTPLLSHSHSRTSTEEDGNGQKELENPFFTQITSSSSSSVEQGVGLGLVRSASSSSSSTSSSTSSGQSDTPVGSVPPSTTAYPFSYLPVTTSSACSSIPYTPTPGPQVQMHNFLQYHQRQQEYLAAVSALAVANQQQQQQQHPPHTLFPPPTTGTGGTGNATMGWSCASYAPSCR